MNRTAFSGIIAGTLVLLILAVLRPQDISARLADGTSTYLSDVVDALDTPLRRGVNTVWYTPAASGGEASPATGAKAPYKYTVRLQEPLIRWVQPMGFEDAVEGLCKVRALGIESRSAGSEFELRKSVDVIHAAFDPQLMALECILRFSCQDGDTEAILALMDKPATLANAVRFVEASISSATAGGAVHSLGAADVVGVPQISFALSSDGREIEFVLDDARGREDTNGKVLLGVPTRYFVISKPFLVYLRSKSSGAPVLVAWVDNLDWLSRLPGATRP